MTEPNESKEWQLPKWDDDQPEIPLLGGDVTDGLVRAGDTVRRPPGEQSPWVRDLLRHLEKAGFEGAPRHLGVDSAGRDVLTYVEGEVAGRPWPSWIADEDGLVSVARLVRAYDDAAESFGMPDAWPAPIEPPGLPPGPPDPPQLVGHRDITPENVVFRDGKAAALIDFDLARPTTRLEEVMNVMLWWGPFGEDADLDPRMRGLDVPRRCRMIADAYGLAEPDRAKLLPVAILQNRRAWHLMKHRAEQFGGGWQRMWDDGVGDKIQRRQGWLDRHQGAIAAALLDA